MDENLNAVKLFNKLADRYNEKYFDVSAYSKSLDFFCNNLKTSHPAILELACGPGNISKYLLEQRSDIKLLGTDLSENMILLAKNNNPSGEFKVMNSKNISELEQNFDGIVCGFLFPYLNQNEIRSVIKSIYSKLNTNGVLYLSTIEDENKKSGPRCGSNGDCITMNYYELAMLEEILSVNQFEVLNIERVDIEDSDVFPKDLIIVCRKKG